MVLFANVKSSTYQTNRLSYCLRTADTLNGNVIMAVLTEALTKQKRGAIASAFLVEQFNYWFEKHLPKISQDSSCEIIQSQWLELLKQANQKLLIYGQNAETPLATTVSILLVFESNIAYQMRVGFSPVVKITSSDCQLSTDIKKQSRLKNKTFNSTSYQNMIGEILGVSDLFQVSFDSFHLNKPTILMIFSRKFFPTISRQEIGTFFNPNIAKSRGLISKNLDRILSLAQQYGVKSDLAAIAILCQ